MIKQRQLHSSELDFNNWKVVSVLSLESFYGNYIHNRRILFCLAWCSSDSGTYYCTVDGRDSLSVPLCNLAKIMDKVSGQDFQFNNEYKGRQDEIGNPLC